MEPSYRGYYINLRTSEARNNAMQAQLRDLGLEEKYRRFEAVDGQIAKTEHDVKLAPGRLGCWLSHTRVLEQNLGCDQHLHITEDDVVLHRQLPQVFAGCESSFEWDLLYTDVYFHPPPSPDDFHRLWTAMRAFRRKRQVSIISLKNLRFTGATSYFVNRSSIDRVYSILNGGWDANIPRDIFLHQRVADGDLKAFTLLPFYSTIRETSLDSTIGRPHIGRNAKLRLEMLNLFRQGFYVDAAVDELRNRAESLREPDSEDSLVSLYLETVRMTLQTANESLH